MLFHATESQSTLIFLITWILLGLAAEAVASSRTGFVGYSVRSMIKTSDWKPTWEVDKSKLPKYLKILVSTIILTAFFMFTFDTRPGDILIAVVMNTLVVAYGCNYWVLCKNKPDSRS